MTSTHSPRLMPTLFVLAFFLLVPIYSAQGADEQRPLNFVFLLVDDLGYGDFGCYGAEFYETPNIDKLAGQGMLFRNGYSACTVCSPSRAAILTGCYPARLKLTDWITGHKRPQAKLSVPNWNMRLDHERTTIPEALRAADYVSGFFGKWHLMPIGQPDFSKHYPDHHGFDINVGGREWGQPKGKGKYFSPFGMPNLDDGKPGDFLTDKLTDAAIDFVNKESAKETPFLLYLSYYALHGPLMGPKDLLAKYDTKAQTFSNRKNEFLDPRRAAMVEKLDDSVGRLMQELDRLGIAEDTVVILTGDNGGDHDETTAGLKAYKGYSHEGGTRVPLMVRWPGKTPPQTTSDELVIGMDFYPTLLEMAGLPAQPDQHRDGVSLVPLLDGTTEALPQRALYWHYPHYHRTNPYGAVRKGDWKLIEFYEDRSLELYDLKNDPFETKNLAEQNPLKAKELAANLDTWRQSTGAQAMAPNPNFDPNAPKPPKGKASLPRQKKANRKLKLLFSDEFERSESQETKDEIGGEWNSNSLKRAGGNKQVDLKDGAMHIKMHATADHAVSVTHPAAFKDGVVKMRFMLNDPEDFLGLNFADLKYKKVHAGHLCMTQIGTKRVKIDDLKTGRMAKDIRAARLAGNVTDEVKAMLKKKSTRIANKLAVGKWHDLEVTIIGDTMTVKIDQVNVGQFKSEGIGHPTKRTLRLAVPREAVVDDVKVFAVTN